MKKRLTALALALSLLMSMTACGAGGDTVLLTAELNAAPVELSDYDGRDAAIELAVKLLQGTAKEESVLLSPLSILYALALTINGAAGDTLGQMEDALGMTREQINGFLSGYLCDLSGDKTVHMANSLWLRNDSQRLTVRKAFLQSCKDCYDAEVFAAAFDEGTCRDINQWAAKHTDGMIREFLNEIPMDAVIYLINALSFDGKWETPYESNQLSDRVFHGRSGDEDCTMMSSRENCYLTGEHATGFMKYYDGYAFAALLPQEGMDVAEYVASLSGEELRSILDGRSYSGVDAGLPQFEGESRFDLAELLASLGMTDLFDPASADLSDMVESSNGSISVSRVLHQTAIEVTAEGTRAAAVTAVEVNDSCAIDEETPPQVILDRPFVYLIVDAETMLPLFIGTVTDIG